MFKDIAKDELPQRHVNIWFWVGPIQETDGLGGEIHIQQHCIHLLTHGARYTLLATKNKETDRTNINQTSYVAAFLQELNGKVEDD